MSGPQTITRRHLDRLAIVYVRQSTLTQVREHTESTARQYALAEEAARLGWEAWAIVTIDTDLGRDSRLLRRSSRRIIHGQHATPRASHLSLWRQL